LRFGEEIQTLATDEQREGRGAGTKKPSAKNTYLCRNYNTMATCISPVTIRKKKEIINVPCQRCIPCMQTRRSQWVLRVHHEVKGATNAHFVTFTYDEEHLPRLADGTATLKHEHMLEFLRKLRKYEYRTARKRANKKYKRIEALKDIHPNILFGRKNPNELKAFKYFGAGEYGDKFQRPHYHQILINVTDETIGELQSLWGKGNVKAVPANLATIAYVAKYCMGLMNIMTEGQERPNNYFSKGLGKSYVDKYGKFHKKTGLYSGIITGEQTASLPRTFKDAIWNKHEKQLLAIEAITEQDKQFQRQIDYLKETGYENPENEYYYRKHHNLELLFKKLTPHTN
jgi:hypothetical protein